ncbi:SDR family NAD(P)-dependent oxidoreductase [Paraburkholderia caribensis]|uniref:SDR family NAD(P)-dependent oxidoreductase n=1 Tax=Paraburkholderia caribensis TaxID=75105 RepID=UPI001C638E47|nr:SDR family NAD(P)-dependent oxidoreductase [Paraburkholderia caribensis]
MLIYVTGAAGFIGSHLVDRLLSLGHRVIGADNLVRGTLDNLQAAFKNENFRFFDLDLTDRASVETILHPVFAAEEKVDTVWHLAANSDIAAGVADPNIDLRDTFMTTFETIALARKFGMHNLAFASTSAVYGESPERLVETLGPLLPISAYGAMKLAGEAIISAAVESFLKQAWIFRFPNVVGSRGTHGVIRDLIDKLLVNRDELEVLGDGEQKKPYLHVADLVDAMIFIWQTAKERRSLYNIGPEDDGAKVSFIAKSIVEASKTNAKLRYTGGDRGWVGDVPRFSYSVEKLAGLGWRPNGGSEAAVRRAIDELIAERGLV